MGTNSAPDNSHASGTPASPRIVRFGVFEFELTRRALSRNGYPIKVQQQPALVLAHLVARAGRLVTREELHAAIWPTGTFVEFEYGLNSAINRLRRTLGDSAGAPQFIETVPKQGYRFIAPLERVLPVSQESVPPANGAPKVVEPVSAAAEVEAVPAPGPRRGRVAFTAGAAAVLAAVSLYLTAPLWRSHSTQPLPVLRYTISAPAGHSIESVVISPAGDQIVYGGVNRGVRMLYRRFLNSDESRPIPGSEGATFPFFSPDGREVGFYTPGSLKAASGAAVRTLAAIPPDYRQWNAFWSKDGIYFNTASGETAGIWRVPAKGGTPERVLDSVTNEAGVDFVFGHQILPGPHPLLLHSAVRGPLRRSIRLLDLAMHTTETLVERGMGGEVLPTGHLVYFWHGSLFAVPFDRSRSRVAGSPVEVLGNVAPQWWSGPNASWSNLGTLVYLQQPQTLRTLQWVDPGGGTTTLPEPPAAYEQAEVSPHGDQLAIVRQDGPDRWTLWIYNLRTGAWTQLLESGVPGMRVVWSPDQKTVVAGSARENADFVNLYRIPIAAPEQAERLAEQPNLGQFPQSWSSAANAILFMEGVHPTRFSDILALPLSGDRRPRPLAATNDWEATPSMAPDGRRFVYARERQGSFEVYIQSYGEPARPPIQVSRGGGSAPLWSLDGKRIYYLSTARSLMEVALKLDGTPGEPRQITPADFTERVDVWTRGYSLSPDGRFLVIRRVPTEAAERSQIHVIVNWFEELKRLSPGA